MRKTQRVRFSTAGYYGCIVVALILFSGCAATTLTHTHSWQQGVNSQIDVVEPQRWGKAETLPQPDFRADNPFEMPRLPYAHTQAGQAGQKSDWGFYAVCFLIIGVSYILILHD